MRVPIDVLDNNLSCQLCDKNEYQNNDIKQKQTK